jgi:hypothetical protein
MILYHLITILLLITGVYCSDENHIEFEEKKHHIDVLSILEKLPIILPFITNMMESETCKQNLTTISEDFHLVGSSGLGTNANSGLKSKICNLSPQCFTEMFKLVGRQLSDEGFFASLILTMLGYKNYDDFLLQEQIFLHYISSMCDTSLNTSSNE